MTEVWIHPGLQSEDVITTDDIEYWIKNEDEETGKRFLTVDSGMISVPDLLRSILLDRRRIAELESEMKKIRENLGVSDDVDLSGRLDDVLESKVMLGAYPRKETLAAIAMEVARARQKHPTTNLNHLTEEYLEVVRAVNDDEGSERIAGEAVQVACVAIRLIEEVYTA